MALIVENIGQRPDRVVWQRQSATLGALLVMLAVVGVVRIGRAHKSEARSAAAPEIVCGIDPNTAPWWEFAQLPGFGESLSRRVVADRERRTANRLFNAPADLLKVRGIGLATLRRITPYLYWPNQPPSVDSAAAGK